MALDLQRLINEVLGMVKESQTKNKSIDPWTQHQYDLENQSLKNRGAVDVQSTQNAGQLGVQESANVGALARQRLVGDTEISKSTIDAEATKYKADQDLIGNLNWGKSYIEANQGKSDDPSKTLDEMIKNGTITTPDQVLDFRKKWKNQSPNNAPTPEEMLNHVTDSSSVKPVGSITTTVTPTVPTVKQPESRSFWGGIKDALDPKFRKTTSSNNIEITPLWTRSNAEIKQNRMALDKANAEALIEEENKKKNRKTLTSGFTF